jgi:ribosome-binding protein aMBF1 (putative translation factor)
MIIIREVGIRLRDARSRAGLTVEEASSKLNIKWFILKRIERGEKKIDIDLFVRAVNLYGVGADYVLCGVLGKCK